MVVKKKPPLPPSPISFPLSQLYNLGEMAALVDLPGAFILGAGAGSYKVAGVNCEVTPSPVPLPSQSPSLLVPTPFLTSSLVPAPPSLPTPFHPLFSSPPSLSPSPPLLYLACHSPFSPPHCPLFQDVLSYIPSFIVSHAHVNHCPQMMPNARVPSNSSPGVNLTYIAKVSTQVHIHLSSTDSHSIPPYCPV